MPCTIHVHILPHTLTYERQSTMVVSRSMFFSPRVVKVFILALMTALAVIVQGVSPDEHEKCGDWADIGECENNASFMLTSCATACDRVQKVAVDNTPPDDFPQENSPDPPEVEENYPDPPEAVEEEEEIAAAVDTTPSDDAPRDTPPEAAVVEEPAVILPFHQDDSVVPLTDVNFEHETQASTGQTTGSWLVVFYDQDLMAASPAVPAEYWSERHIVLGAVKATDAPETIDRFEIDHLPAILFLHNKKVYPYPEDRLAAATKVKWMDLAAFCEFSASAAEGQARDIPPPPTFMSRLETKLDAMGLSTSVVMAAQVSVVVVGLWLTAVVGATRKAKPDTKKVS
jgi:hypothetical protein